jgi:tetratricopeptide (TPR) repeat protein
MFRFLKNLLRRASEGAKSEEEVVDPKTQCALEQFVTDVARNPNDAVAYARMGQWWHWKRQYAKSLDLLDRSIRLDPNFAYARCARADLLASCPDAAYRDGASAVGDALEALDIARRKGQLSQDWRQRMYLRILAAAYAETGDFDAAIETERQSLGLAITNRAIGAIKAHLAKYESREAIRAEAGLITHGPGDDSP